MRSLRPPSGVNHARDACAAWGGRLAVIRDAQLMGATANDMLLPFNGRANTAARWIDHDPTGMGRLSGSPALPSLRSKFRPARQPGKAMSDVTIAFRGSGLENDYRLHRARLSVPIQRSKPTGRSTHASTGRISSLPLSRRFDIHLQLRQRVQDRHEKGAQPCP